MTPDKRLGLVLAINVVMVLALVAVGLAAGSLGVLASGADYLGDALGTGLSLVALRLSRHPHGHPRATSYAALVNASLLLLVTVAVAAEAIYRLSTGAPSVDGLPVVIVSIIAAAAMIACALILGDVAGDFNMQSVMLDSVADAAAAIGVAISGAVILITGGSTGSIQSLLSLSPLSLATTPGGLFAVCSSPYPNRQRKGSRRPQDAERVRPRHRPGDSNRRLASVLPSGGRGSNPRPQAWEAMSTFTTMACQIDHFPTDAPRTLPRGYRRFAAIQRTDVVAGRAASRSLTTDPISQRPWMADALHHQRILLRRAPGSKGSRAAPRPIRERQATSSPRT